MSERNYGGPAFPFSPPCDSNGQSATGYPYPELGMGMRDYLAAHAPISLEDIVPMFNFTLADLGTDANRAMVMAVLVMTQYEYADAMIAEREK